VIELCQGKAFYRMIMIIPPQYKYLGKKTRLNLQSLYTVTSGVVFYISCGVAEKVGDCAQLQALVLIEVLGVTMPRHLQSTSLKLPQNRPLVNTAPPLKYLPTHTWSIKMPQFCQIPALKKTEFHRHLSETYQSHLLLSPVLISTI